MSEPTSGGSTEIGKAHYVVDLKDNTDKGLSGINKKIADSNNSTRRQIQNTAQTARNAVSIVTRSVGSNITNTVLEPIISIGESFSRVAESAELSGTKIQRAVKGIQLAGAGAVGAGIGITLLGAREKQATDQLANAIRDLGLDASAYGEEIEKVVAQQEKFGHTAIQSKQALQLLTNATHDPTVALDDMGEVADLAASRHLSLDQAARQVAITIGGGGRLLKQYNIDVIKNTDGTRNYAAMNAKLADVISGQATSAVDNWGGRIRALGVEIEDNVAIFGQHWGPTITMVGGALFTLSTAIELVANHKARKLLAATQEATAAQEEEAAVTTASTDDIVAALQAQTIAAEAAAAAFSNLLVSSEAAAAGGMGGAAGAGVGVGTAELTGAAGGAAAGVGEAEQGLMAETGRMQAFWDEVMANMAADIQASAGSITASISEEETALAEFTTLFEEAFASMAAAAGGATAEEIAALGALAYAEDAAAVGAAGLGAATTEAAVGGLTIFGVALAPLVAILGIGAVAIAGADLAFHSFGYSAAAAVPPMNALTEAIKANYGEINNFAIAQIDQTAASNGMLEGLNRLGISTQQFNEYVQQGPKGLDELGKQINMTRMKGSDLIVGMSVMGKEFDSHEQVLSYLKNSYDKWAESIGKTISMAKSETEAVTNLTDDQVEQAKTLHMTAEQYSALIIAIADKTAKQTTETEQNVVAIASNESLQAVLDNSLSSYNSLTQGLLNTVYANEKFNSSLQAVQSIHAFLDPAMQAYQQWVDSSNQVAQAQQQEAQSAQQSAKAVSDAKRREADAEQNVNDVRKKGRQEVRAAEKDIITARQDVAQKLRDANQKVIDSELAAKDATNQVSDARKRAQAQIVDSIRTLRDMAEGEQKARDDLLTAQLDAKQKAHDLAQDALNSATGLTQQQLIDKQRVLDQQQTLIDKQRNGIAERATKDSVIDAQHKLNDLMQDDINKRKESQEIVKDGIRRNPDVLKALKAQRDAENAITKAKRDQIKAEQDGKKEIKDALEKLTAARQKAAHDNKVALQQEKDAEDNLKQAEQQQASAADSARRAIDQATTSLHNNRAKLTEVEIQTGQTDSSLRHLRSTMATMDKDLTLKYQAVGVKATGQATVSLQRAIEETLLEAGGASPSDARRRALHDIPDWGTSSKKGGGGYTIAPGGAHKPALAAGGPVHGPGGPTDDKVPALLSNDEHVWTAAEVQAAGGHETVHRLRQAALEGAVHGYAGGGPVSHGPVIDARRMKLIDRLKNSGMLSMLGKGYQGTDKYGNFSMAGWPNTEAVLRFLHEVDSKPYVYGAVGPGAYDCSGLVGEVWARLTRHPSFHRYFVTENEANFFEPGPGTFTVGVTNRGGTNHTAGRLKDLKFEARDSQEGIIIGPNATAPERFDHVYHLKERSGWPSGPGGGTGNVGLGGHLSMAAARRAGMTLLPSGWSWPDLNNVFSRESSWRWNATGARTPLGQAYGIPQALPGSKMGSMGSDWHDNAVTQIKWGLGYIKDRYGNPTRARQHEDAFNWYDNGGVLPTGPSLTMNGTGKPEAVFTQDQIKKLIDNKGIHIENLNFQIDASSIDEVGKLIGILNDLPQAIRAQRAGSIRKVNR